MFWLLRDCFACFGCYAIYGDCFGCLEAGKEHCESRREVTNPPLIITTPHTPLLPSLLHNDILSCVQMESQLSSANEEVGALRGLTEEKDKELQVSQQPPPPLPTHTHTHPYLPNSPPPPPPPPPHRLFVIVFIK